MSTQRVKAYRLQVNTNRVVGLTRSGQTLEDGERRNGSSHRCESIHELESSVDGLTTTQQVR